MQNTTAKPRKQNPISFYLRTLLYMFIALVLRAVVFLPLVALFYFPEGSPLRWLSLLCPVLFVFFLLPLRFSFADALVQSKGQRFFAFDVACGFRHYGEKLGESLLHCLSVAKWMIPLATGGVYAYLYQKDVGASALLEDIGTLGQSVMVVWSKVVNFFRDLFGHMEQDAFQGGVGEGLLFLVIVAGVLTLIALIGVLRNSATRYVWAYANHNEKNPRREVRRRVRNRRFAQFIAALINLIFWAPFVYMLHWFLKDVIANFATQAMYLLAGSKMDLSFLVARNGQLLYCFFLFYLPFLPLRRFVTAFFAAKTIDRRHSTSAPVAEAPQAVEPAPMQSLQDVKPVPAWPPQEETTSVPVQEPPMVFAPFVDKPLAAPEQPVSPDPEPAPYEAPQLPFISSAPSPYSPEPVPYQPEPAPYQPEPAPYQPEPVAATPYQPEAAPSQEMDEPAEEQASAQAEPDVESSLEPEAPAYSQFLFGGEKPADSKESRQDVDPSAFTLGQ